MIHLVLFISIIIIFYFKNNHGELGENGSFVRFVLFGRVCSECTKTDVRLDDRLANLPRVPQRPDGTREQQKRRVYHARVPERVRNHPDIARRNVRKDVFESIHALIHGFFSGFTRNFVKRFL